MWVLILLSFGLVLRLGYLMVGRSSYYEAKADDIHERERRIKAQRGLIYDRNGIVLADNQAVCNITVIHNQITDPEKVIKVLSQELQMSEENVRKRVEKVSSIQKIRSNVPKAIGDRIRSYKLDGVNVDEDYSRYYPYDTLASSLALQGGIIRGFWDWR